MKKKNIFFLGLVLLVASACNLDVFPDSSVSSDSYWRSEDDAKAAVNGLYTRMRNMSSYEWVYWFDARSCIVGPGRTPGGVVQYNANELSSIMSDVNWNSQYVIVSQANSIINNIDKVNFAKTATHDELLAQAYFFRAWAYYNLVRLWGDVPIVTNFIASLDDPQLYPERSPKADVWKLITEDIDKADELYKSTSVVSRNRVSRAAILMLKTDIYLWLHKVEDSSQGYLDKAEKAVKEVVSYTSNYEILDSYADVFGKEDNKEIIYAIYHDVLENSAQYGTLFAQVSNVPASHKNNPIPCGNSTNNPMAFSESFMTQYRNDPSVDTRSEYICNDTKVGETTYRWTKKYMGELIGGKREFNTDTRVYRYAEAVMFYAEILAEKGDIENAVKELNKVVKRAYGTPSKYPTTMTEEEFLSTLLDERIIEFAGEAKSWFDMIRFGEVFNRVATLKGRENDKKGNILLMPVFHETINRNSKIKQTPGYEE